MGFDLIGIESKNEHGEYFRNNVWWWRPLWTFICEVVSEIDDNDAERGCFNDGYIIKGSKHKAIKEKLEKALNNPKAYEEFITLLKKRVGKNYPFDWENVKQFKEFVDNNEGFEIW